MSALATADYYAFLERRAQAGSLAGFAPTWMPDYLFDFQALLVEWAVRKGRAAIFADCGMGKTLMQLVWAQNVVEHTKRPVLILTPLAVGPQTVTEGATFGIACERSRDGQHSGRGIVVTNYEKLHLFNAADFAGVVCDESSILKHFNGATQKAVTRFLLKVPYRLLCTATAAPNDYIELGTSSEALGELGHSEMLTRFFKQDEQKPHRMEEVKRSFAAQGKHYGQERSSQAGAHFAKLAFRVSQSIGQWRLKGHAVVPFWRWVASWARACRKPSDLGCDDGPFLLPPLIERDHIIKPKQPANGMLFTIPAVGLKEERDERRRTLQERCALAVELVQHERQAVIWCHLNAEGDLLATMLGSAGRQVKGDDSDEEKEAAYRAFAAGDIRVLAIKPKIGAWGLNWQFCDHVVTFASHSYEQCYQSIRRCWRFGQTRPVTVDIISTEGEAHVRENMQRKAQAAEQMFTELVRYMQGALRVERTREDRAEIEVPPWA